MGISNIKQLYSEWKSLQPLKPEDLKRWNDKFKLEFNYNSNHLEGNTLTYGQTKLLLMFGETSGNASLKDYEEMKAHNVGLERRGARARPVAALPGREAARAGKTRKTKEDACSSPNSGIISTPCSTLHG